MNNLLKLNSDQEEAFESIKTIMQHPTANTFVLNGYAGTGKTFLMQYLATWLNEIDSEFKLLASTGRAAAVLRGKTGFEAKTVHGELYHFSKVNGDDDNIPDDAPVDRFGQMTLQFTLRIPDDKVRIFIVDEASMLSSEFMDNTSFATFGSGMLLTDFFEYAGRNKIIFVGDPCQLPPVGQNFSPALDLDWLKENKRLAVSYTLQKIERTNSDNDILKLAHRIRDLSQEAQTEKFSRLPARKLDNVILAESEDSLLNKYIVQYKETGINSALAIARSNKMVHKINREVRLNLHGEIDLPLQIGEVLLVTQNNYAAPLTNGDFVTITEIGEVYNKANLHFQKVKVKTVLSEKEYELLLSLDILYGDSSNFTREQSKNLMVDFSRRVRSEKIKANSDKYKKAMMEDEYLNCLKATYGYAVTCHKSQGGEWDNIYLFLDKGMYAMKYEELHRWWYTAITRTRNRIYSTNEWWVSDYTEVIKD